MKYWIRSIFVVLLFQVVVSLGFLYQENTSYFRLSNLVLGLNFAIVSLFFLLYVSFHPGIQNHLITTKILKMMILSQLCYFILELITLETTFFQNHLFTVLLYSVATSFENLLPVLFLVFLLQYRSRPITLISIIPALYIFMYHLANSLLGSYFDIIQLDGISFILERHPSSFNLIMLSLAYLVVALQLISALSFQSISLPRRSIALKIVIFVKLCVLPFLEFSSSIFPPTDQFSFIVYTAQHYLSNIFSLIIFLPLLANHKLLISLVPQPARKLIVIDDSGIPILGYDFTNHSTVLEAELMFSGSFQAILLFIESTFTNVKMKSLTLADGKLIVVVEKGLTFLFYVDRETNLLTSSFESFVKQTLLIFDVIPPTRKTQNLIHNPSIWYLFTSLFALPETISLKAMKPDPLVSTSSKMQNQIVLHLFIIISFLGSIRFILFESSTRFLPRNETVSEFFVLFATLSIVILLTLLLFNLKPSIKYSVYLLLVLFLLSSIVNSPLSLWFRFPSVVLTGYLFIINIATQAQKTLSYRFRVFVIGFLLDQVLRLPTLGTDPLLWEVSIAVPLNFILFSSLLIFFLLQNDGYYPKIIITWPSRVDFDKIIKTLMVTITLLFSIRYFLNPTILSHYLFSSSLLSFNGIFVMLNAVWLVITVYIFDKYVQHWSKNQTLLMTTVVVILGIVTFHYNEPLGVMLFPFFQFAVLVFLSTNIFEIPLNSKSIEKAFHFKLLDILKYLLPILLAVVLFVLNFYGSSLLVLVIPVLFLLNQAIKSDGSSPILDEDKDFPQINKSHLNFRSNIIWFHPAILLIFMLCTSLLVPYTAQADVTLDHSNEFITLLNYNIQYGVSTNYKYQPEELANYVINSGADIVTFQEVTRNSFLNGNGDLYMQLYYFLQPSGYHYASIMPMKMGVVTNVIFSKLPFLASNYYMFPDTEINPRGMLVVEVEFDETILTIANTHLTHIFTQSGNNTRAKQAAYALKILKDKSNVILVGDFNDTPESETIMLVTQQYTDLLTFTSINSGYTWPSSSPVARIDYAFSNVLDIQEFRVDQVLHSDHLPLFITAKLSI